jgi:HEAT repeat protein
MKRCAAVLVLLLSSASLAKPNTGAEASKVLDQFLSGQMPLNAAMNRVQYLGQEAFVTHELALAFKRTGEPRQRAAILEFIAALAVPDEDVERLLLRLLKSDDTGEVMSAARGLGKMKCDDAVKPLIELLEHKMLGIRRESARALGLIGKPQASAPLLKAAKLEQDLELKVLLIASAGKAGDKKQAPALEALLADSSESTRLAAGQALCALGAAKCAQFAQKLLASADRNERFQAVMLFEGSSAKVSSATLMPLLKEGDDKLRARAARILVQGGDAKRLEWLVLESAKAKGEVRLVYEDELERLRLTDEQRQAILKKAGLQ